MGKVTPLLLLLVFFLTACTAPDGGNGWGNDIPDPTQGGDPQLYVQSIQAKGTALAAQETAQYFAAFQTATADAYNAESTRQAFQVTKQAAQAEKQSTQQAWAVTAAAAEQSRVLAAEGTRQAADSTQRAWVATATADSALSTSAASTEAIKMQWTQQAQDRQATADVAAVIAQSTAVAAQAQSAELAAERARMVNQALAWSPYAIGILLVAVLVFAGISLARRESHKPHEVRDGNQRLIGIQIDKGGKSTLLIPDRSVYPYLTVGKNGVEAPALPEPSLQAEITRNAQAVLALQSSDQAARLIAETFGKPGATPPPIYGPGEQPPQIDSGTLPVLDGQWREVSDSESWQQE